MRVPYQAMIIGIALAFASAPSALAGGKGGGGSTSTAVVHQDFSIQKLHDTASAPLYRTAPTGSSRDAASGQASGKRQHSTMHRTESFSLSFGKIKVHPKQLNEAY
jgi:type VI protein secretion system component Hcp